MGKTLELGSGMRPTPGIDVYHDRIKHSPHINVAHNLDKLPYPWADEEFSKIVAMDVMEHCKQDVEVWLNELWRILEPGGQLVMRLPSWTNPLSYRDPTHRRVFHKESFDYWDPRKEIHAEFGAIYFAEAQRWWTVENVKQAHIPPKGDYTFTLRKIG